MKIIQLFQFFITFIQFFIIFSLIITYIGGVPRAAFDRLHLIHWFLNQKAHCESCFLRGPQIGAWNPRPVVSKWNNLHFPVFIEQGIGFYLQLPQFFSREHFALFRLKLVGPRRPEIVAVSIILAHDERISLAIAPDF